jgi:hypothetical protein
MFCNHSQVLFLTCFFHSGLLLTDADTNAIVGGVYDGTWGFNGLLSAMCLGGELACYSGCYPEFFSLYSHSERSDSTLCSGGLYCNISIERY